MPRSTAVVATTSAHRVDGGPAPATTDLDRHFASADDRAVHLVVA